MPADDIYLPLQVGALISEVTLPYLPDDTGDNISAKNKNFCELTGIYWAWKNLDADYIGLVHYRRYFSSRKNFKDKYSWILNRKEIENLLDNCSVLLPKQRNYWIETNYSQYVHAHHKEDLDITRDIIETKYHDYLESFDVCMKSTKGHRFNMFIMDRKHFNSFCEWLFPILFELEKRLDISMYSAYDARVFGFVSERLLDVFLMHNKIAFQDIPYVFLEKQNWIKKAIGFVKRKFTHREN